MKIRRFSIILTLILGLTSILLTACGDSVATPATGPASTTATSNQKVALKLGLVSSLIDYLPIYIAQTNGLFDKQGLAVEITYFDLPSKAVQALSANSVDLTTMATDTSVNAIEKGANQVQVAGVYNKATYSFIVQKGIKSFAELKGKNLAVSDLKDSSTLLLMKMLQANGLKPDDYTLLSIGGSAKRAAAVASGQAAGALIGIPNNFTVEAAGYPSLGYTVDAIQAYQFDVLTADRDWAKKNSATVVRYQKAINEATGWLYNPANKEAATAILAKEFKVTPEIAAKVYDQVVVRLQAFPKAGEFDLNGYKVVLQIMNEMDLLKAPLPSPDKYIDTSYLDKARQA